MPFEAILYDVSEGVATITLNKPERLNAFDDQMLDEMGAGHRRSQPQPGCPRHHHHQHRRGFCSGMNVAKNEVQGTGVLQSESTTAIRRHSLRNQVHRIPASAHPARKALYRGD